MVDQKIQNAGAKPSQDNASSIPNNSLNTFNNSLIPPAHPPGELREIREPEGGTREVVQLLTVTTEELTPEVVEGLKVRIEGLNNKIGSEPQLAAVDRSSAPPSVAQNSNLPTDDELLAFIERQAPENVRSKRAWARTCLTHDRDYWRQQMCADQQRRIESAQMRGVSIDERHRMRQPSGYRVYLPPSYEVEPPKSEPEERERIANLLRFAQAAGRKPSPAIAQRAKELGLELPQSLQAPLPVPQPPPVPKPEFLPIPVLAAPLLTAQAPSSSSWVGTSTLLDAQTATIAANEWTQTPERSHTQQADLSDLQAEIRCHRKRLGWDGLQWQTYLEDNFGATMTLELDDRQLRSLLDELECEVG